MPSIRLAPAVRAYLQSTAAPRPKRPAASRQPARNWEVRRQRHRPRFAGAPGSYRPLARDRDRRPSWLYRRLRPGFAGGAADHCGVSTHRRRRVGGHGRKAVRWKCRPCLARKRDCHRWRARGAHPCLRAAKARTSGACPGYRKDHVVPLACGGPDAVSNLQWQTIADARAKDAWEGRACAR